MIPDTVASVDKVEAFMQLAHLLVGVADPGLRRAEHQLVEQRDCPAVRVCVAVCGFAAPDERLLDGVSPVVVDR